MSKQLEAAKERHKVAMEQAKSLYAVMEADPAQRTSENNEKLDKMTADAAAAISDIKRIGQFLAQIDAESQPAGEAKAANQPDPTSEGRGVSSPQFKSVGRLFTDSKEYKAAQADPSSRTVAPVAVKALYEGVAANGGAGVFSDRRTDVIDRAPILPTTFLDILNVSPTDSNLIEYPVSTGMTNSAAEVIEYTAGNYGIKPESDLAFALANAPVVTIAHWIRASRNLLADAPQMRAFIDTKMMQGLRSRLETQALAGNGVAPNLLGFLNVSGVQNRVMNGTTPVGRAQTTTDTKLDTLRRAITDIRLAGGDPNAIILNSADAEALELAKNTQGNYLNGYDPVALRVWRVRVVENTRIPAGTGLIGDFAMGATMFMREDVTIRVSEHTQDDFIRNAIRVLAEMRAALAVEIPVFFEKLTLI